MAIATSGHARTAGPFASLKELGRTAVDILHTRFDLLVTEIAEEQSRLAELLLYALLAALCLFVAVVVLAVLLVTSFWDTPYRLLATGIVAALLLVAGSGFLIAFVAKARAKPVLFRSSLDELGADIQRFK